MQRPKHGDDNDDLVDYVKQSAHKVGQAITLPSPLGRNQAGWGPLQFKVQPEVLVMLDQIREHPYFSGVWKTQAQVAWSMLYLGLQAMSKFLDPQWNGWRKFQSNYVVYHDAAYHHHKLASQHMLVESARMYRDTFKEWIERDNEVGKYMAWKVLDAALNAREIVTDCMEYDKAVLYEAPQILIHGTQVSNPMAAYYKRCVPNIGWEVDEKARDLVYVELTNEYFLSLDAARGTDDNVDPAE